MSTPLHTRRLFIQRSLSLLAAVPTVPMFLDSTAMAMNASLDDGFRIDQSSGSDGKILVIVQLSGGNDGLNTVIPYADDTYYRSRPNLAKPANDVLKLDDYVGLNPVLAPLMPLVEAGQMSVIQGVGYPNPNRSHFRSMDIWHTAKPDDEQATSGWLGRYFDATCAGVDPKTQTSAATPSGSTLGLSIGESLPLAMRGERQMPTSFERAEAFSYRGKHRDDFMELVRAHEADAPMGDSSSTRSRRNAKRNDVQNPSADDQLSFLSRTALDAVATSDRIIEVTQGHQPGVQYPRGELGDGLRTIAAMIAGELPTRVYYATHGGFDTHANQAGRHDQLLTTFAQAMAAFMADLKAQGNDQRVVVMTFSEFGRRVAQNASQGTDHGAAAPMFVFGPRVRGGVLGKHPSLTDLDAGDLKYHTDFRNVYASLLEHWLDVPSKPILGKQFETAKLVRG